MILTGEVAKFAELMETLARISGTEPDELTEQEQENWVVLQYAFSMSKHTRAVVHNLLIMLAAVHVCGKGKEFNEAFEEMQDKFFEVAKGGE